MDGSRRADRFTGCVPRLSPAFSEPMNAQVAQVHLAIIELRGFVRAGIEAGLAAHAFLPVDQCDASLVVLGQRALWAGRNTWRVKTVHA